MATYTPEYVQSLKDAAALKYNTQDKFTIIYENTLTEMFHAYDALVAQGYTRADDSYLQAVNGNLTAVIIIYMQPSAEVQEAALQAIYDDIDAEYPITDGAE